MSCGIYYPDHEFPKPQKRHKPKYILVIMSKLKL